MALETNPAGLINVSPVQAPKSVSSEGLSKKIGDSSGRSAFQPQTNVNIKSSIEDITGLLSKVASTENMTANKLPQELQKMIQTMLQNSFSLESTLSQGMGSSMESQRFTLEQLSALSRMLTQLGTVAEQGAATTLPDTLQALLSSLKALDGADGKLLDSVHLNKLAFQLLDSQSLENFPVELQALLGASGGQTLAALPAEKAESFAFLKQLIQYFMPAAPEAPAIPEDGAGGLSQKQADLQSGGQGNASGRQQNTAGNSAPAQANATAGNLNRNAVALPNSPGQSPAGMAPAEGQTAEGQPAPQIPGTAQPTGAPPLPGAMPQTGGQQPGPGNQPAAGAQAPGTAPPAGAQPLPGQTGTQQVPGTVPQAGTLPAQAGNGLPAGGMQTTLPSGTMQPAGTAPPTGIVMPQNGAGQLPGTAQQGAAPNGGSPAGKAGNTSAGELQNTAETMQTMKSLAGLLLRDATLTDQDTLLLKSFVNGKQQLMSQQDAKQLQLLIRLSEKNMPASIQQAAQKENMPDLPKLWSFVQLCDLSELKDMQAQQLKTAGKNINDFATVLRQSMPNENTVSDNQRSMSFMMPLYMGENQKSYPTYVHVYDEKKKNAETGEESKETWLRFCLLTENIGAVELVLRLYEKQNLNVRLAFSDENAVKSFREYIPEFKATFEESPLVLTDLKVSAIGSK